MLSKKDPICCTKQQLMKKRQSFILPIFFSHALSNIHLSDAGYCFTTFCSISSLCRYLSCFYPLSYTLIVFSSHFSFSFCSTTLFFSSIVLLPSVHLRFHFAFFFSIMLRSPFSHFKLRRTKEPMLQYKFQNLLKNAHEKTAK